MSNLLRNHTGTIETLAVFSCMGKGRVRGGWGLRGPRFVPSAMTAAPLLAGFKSAQEPRSRTMASIPSSGSLMATHNYYRSKGTRSGLGWASGGWDALPGWGGCGSSGDEAELRCELLAEAP